MFKFIFFVLISILLTGCEDSSTNPQLGNRRLSSVKINNNYTLYYQYNGDQLQQILYNEEDKSDFTLEFHYLEDKLDMYIYDSHVVKFFYNTYPEVKQALTTYESIDFTYYPDGKLKSKSGGEMTKTLKTYTYDENGNFDVIRDSSDTDDNYTITKRKYNYDENGKLFEVNCEVDKVTYSGVSWEFYNERYFYEGDLLTKVYLRNRDIFYTYNDNGLISSKKVFEDDTLINEHYFEYKDGYIDRIEFIDSEGYTTIETYSYEEGNSNNEELYSIAKNGHSWNCIEDEIFPERKFKGRVF